MIIERDRIKYSTEMINSSEISGDLLAAWAELERRSTEGNPYLSPYFILPALKYLTPGKKVILVTVNQISGIDRHLTGVGVFEYNRGTKNFPLPHMSSYRSPHSYLSGLLVDEQFSEPTLEAFFAFFKTFPRNIYGVEFINRTANTKLAQQLEIAATNLDHFWFQYDEKQRSILVPKQVDNGYLKTNLSSKMNKNMRRCKKILSEKGMVNWQILFGKQIDAEHIDNFLQLENMGWKNANGSSLLSKPSDESFFREMIKGFAQNDRAFFTELSVNDKVIASTSNLISSRMGYAFKIGWDPQYAQASPGILNEVEFIEQGASSVSHLEYIDSGAQEGSFIEKVWTDRYSLSSGSYVHKRVARSLLKTIDSVRRLKRFVKKR